MSWKSTLGSLGQVLDVELLSVAKVKVTVGSLLIIAIIAVATHFISRYAQNGIERALKRRGMEHGETIRAARRTAHVLVLLCGLVAALQMIGIDLSTLFAAGAVFAVGLGFAMQNIAQNFVSGVILLVERLIKPDDILEVDGQVVRVVRMGIRATIARTRDDEELIIPNASLCQSTVKNYTMSDPIHLLKATVGVVYGSDMKRVRETLLKAARSLKWREPTHEPLVLLREFGNSSVNFSVFVWTSNPWMGRQLVSDLNETLWWALRENGITIAFPQLDLHLDPSVEQSLHLAASR